MIRNNQISSRQVRLLLILQMFSTPILILPRIMAGTVQQDGWLIPAIGLVVGGIYVFYITGLTMKFPGKTICEFAPIITGKIIGNLIISLFMVKILISTAFELRLLCEIIRQVLLPNTPTSVIMMLMLFTVAYLVGAGIEAYGRMAELLVFIVFIPFVFVLAFIIAKADYRQLLPLLQSKPWDIARATYYVSLTFMPLEFMLLFTGFMSEPDRAKSSCRWAIFVIFILETIIIILSYVGIGITEVKRNFWPVLTLVQNIQFPGAFIENQEIAMISCWILSIFVYIGAGVYSTSLISGRICNFKKDNFFILPLIPIIYILAMLPSSFGQVYNWNNIFRVYFGAVFLLAIPLILLVVARIRKVGQ